MHKWEEEDVEVRMCGEREREGEIGGIGWEEWELRSKVHTWGVNAQSGWVLYTSACHRTGWTCGVCMEHRAGCTCGL